MTYKKEKRWNPSPLRAFEKSLTHQLNVLQSHSQLQQLCFSKSERSITETGNCIKYVSNNLSQTSRTHSHMCSKELFYYLPDAFHLSEMHTSINQQNKHQEIGQEINFGKIYLCNVNANKPGF